MHLGCTWKRNEQSTIRKDLKVSSKKKKKKTPSIQALLLFLLFFCTKKFLQKHRPGFNLNKTLCLKNIKALTLNGLRQVPCSFSFLSTTALIFQLKGLESKPLFPLNIITEPKRLYASLVVCDIG